MLQCCIAIAYPLAADLSCWGRVVTSGLHHCLNVDNKLAICLAKPPTVGLLKQASYSICIAPFCGSTTPSISAQICTQKGMLHISMVVLNSLLES